MPRFVLKEMEVLYIEELKSSINLLMANLESLPVSKGSADSRYGLQRFKRYNVSGWERESGSGISIAYILDIAWLVFCLERLEKKKMFIFILIRLYFLLSAVAVAWLRSQETEELVAQASVLHNANGFRLS